MAALRLIAVGRGEADVDMLAGSEPVPLRRLQEKSLPTRFAE
jgi:hypothetical protein